MESKEVLMAKVEMKGQEITALTMALTSLRTALEEIEDQLKKALDERSEIFEELIKVSVGQ